MTAPDLAALEALLAKATPGPWARERGSIYVAHEGDDHRAGTLFVAQGIAAIATAQPASR